MESHVRVETADFLWTFFDVYILHAVNSEVRCIHYTQLTIVFLQSMPILCSMSNCQRPHQIGSSITCLRPI